MHPDPPLEVLSSDEDDPMMSDDGGDDNGDNGFIIPEYKKAIQKRREENRNLLKSLGMLFSCVYAFTTYATNQIHVMELLI